MSDYEKGFIHTNRGNEPILTEDKLIINGFDEINNHHRVGSLTKLVKESFTSSFSNNSSYHEIDNIDRIQSARRRLSTKIDDSSKW